MMKNCSWLLLAFSLVVAGRVMALDDLNDRIAALDAKIRLNPRNGMLYLMRGELHHVHEEWDAALADYTKVSELNPSLTEVELLRGQTLFAAGRLDQAKAALDKFLDQKPGDVDGLLTRARVLLKQGNRLAAAADFTKAIKGSPSPSVDLYVERAQAFIAAGTDHIEDALRSLDEGVVKLGPVVGLEQPAIELEMQRKNYDGALARLEKMSTQFEFKETFLVRRAEICEQAGRKDDARQAYNSALKALELLPADQRTTLSTRALEKRVRAALDRLAAK